jgi:hypothetical protein
MLRIFDGRTAALLFSACLSTIAGATAQRTFVRSDGVDNASCSIALPCRQFTAAVTATSANGEVIVLDSAGYGVITIAKSVAIIAPPGVYAGVSVLSGDGITVSAGASDKIVLRGLTINGQGGNVGIRIISGREIHVEDCAVANLLQQGIVVQGGGRIQIKDCKSNAPGAPTGAP